MARRTMGTLVTVAAALVSASTEQAVSSHFLASSPAFRPRQFMRSWARDPNMPVRYHIAVLCDWKDDDDYKKKESHNGFTQNVAMFVQMFETNTEWNVTRIHFGELDKLINNVFDLVIEVGMCMKMDLKKKMLLTRRFVRVQYGHEYHLDQAHFIHDAYNKQNTKYYTRPDRLWISPHFEHSGTYLAAMYDTRVRVVPFIWSARPSLPVQTANDFQQAVATGQRNILIVAVNAYTQKSALLPLIMVNELWKKNPNAFDHVWIVSGSESFERDFWRDSKTLLGQLKVYWSSTNKAFFSKRTSFEKMLTRGPMVLLEHQDEWGLNYLTLEALHTRIPVVHNSPYFRDQGFFYGADNVTAGVEQLELALAEFGPRDNDAAVDSFSPHNPEALAVYSDLVEDAMTSDTSEKEVTPSAQHCDGKNYGESTAQTSFPKPLTLESSDKYKNSQKSLVPAHVVFATLKPNATDQRRQIEANFLKNLERLIVHSIIFSDDETERNAHGTPFLGNMYEKAFKLYPNANTYTYINGDILLNESFVEAADALYNMVETGKLKRRFLGVGTRTNVDWLSDITPSGFSDAFARGHLETPQSSDYFMVTRQTFDWKHEIPPFVIGRPGYDNWLMHYAQTSSDVELVDLTRAVPAIHMTGKLGNKEHMVSPKPDQKYNFDNVRWTDKFSTGTGSYQTFEGETLSAHQRLVRPFALRQKHVHTAGIWYNGTESLNTYRNLTKKGFDCFLLVHGINLKTWSLTIDGERFNARYYSGQLGGLAYAVIPDTHYQQVRDFSPYVILFRYDLEIAALAHRQLLSD